MREDTSEDFLNMADLTMSRAAKEPVGPGQQSLQNMAIYAVLVAAVMELQAINKNRDRANA